MSKQLSLSEVSLGLVLFTLPIALKANTAALILFFLYNLYERIKNRIFPNLMWFLPCIILVLIHLFGYFNSEDIGEANKKLILFFSLFVSPLFFTQQLEKIKLEQMLMFLFYGVILMALYGICGAGYDILVLDVRYDYGRGVDLLLKYIPHHTYFSMYTLSSILIISYMVGKKQIKAYYLLFMPILYLVIFLLPSRTTIMFAVIVLPFFILFFLKDRFKKPRVLALLSSLLLILFMFGFSLDYTRDKILFAFYEVANISTEEKPFYGISRRKILWQSSMELIKDKPFWGYGLGDAQYYLNKTYRTNGHLEVLNMNSHNQYLQNAIFYGIPLASVFFGSVLWIVVKLAKKKEILLLGIWGVILTVFLTESTLNRQWGIIFFAFMLTLSCLAINRECHPLD